MTLTIAGLILIAFGLLYVRRPAVYRRGVWLKTSLAIRYLSEEQYRKYIKGIGYVFMLAGIVLVLWEQVLGR
ncbi:MAG: hypothetical protein U1F10_13155 [Burkholderiales bacterium]